MGPECERSAIIRTFRPNNILESVAPITDVCRIESIPCIRGINETGLVLLSTRYTRKADGAE